MKWAKSSSPHFSTNFCAFQIKNNETTVFFYLCFAFIFSNFISYLQTCVKFFSHCQNKICCCSYLKSKYLVDDFKMMTILNISSFGSHCALCTHFLQICLFSYFRYFLLWLLNRLIKRETANPHRLQKAT